VIPRVLTIAGSDSGGGAGIQADLKTFTVLGVYGMSVLTSVTAQNTRGVTAVSDVPVETIEAQFDAVVSDIGVDAAKTGMLSSRAIIEAVAARLRRAPIRQLVVDPVMRAKGGDPLLHPEAADALRDQIVPLAAIVTPNRHEAEALARLTIDGPAAAEEAARRIHALGAQAVVIKDGGRDLFYDGGEMVWLEGERIDTRSLHGTGCTLSAAMAAHLARGLAPIDAAREAKKFVTVAIRRAHPLGQGHGPVNHLWPLEES